MRIGLGTAQLGLNYGATNKTGKPNDSMASSLLNAAWNGGFTVVDTASTYGDSEMVLGKSLPRDWHPEIVTKLPPLRGRHVHILEDSLQNSLTRLRRPITGLLVHHGSDLLETDGHELIKVLSRIKASGLVAKIGFSAYTAEEIDALLGVFEPDIVQLPSSLVDQRLIDSGHITQLHEQGVEVHCRSVLLQGLLLEDKNNMHIFFKDLFPTLDLLKHWSKEINVSKLTICLAFLMQTNGIDSLILGASTASEVAEISEAALKAKTCPELPWEKIPRIDSKVLNPTCWPHRDQILNFENN